MRVGGPKDPNAVQKTPGEPSLAELRAQGQALAELARSGQIDVSSLIGLQREAVAPLSGALQRGAAAALQRRDSDG